MMQRAHTLPVAILRSGERLSLAQPQSASVRASDMAEHLSKLCRWVGAPAVAFSVAQHSVLVAEAMHAADGPVAGLYGLLHDGHEYVMGDISEPTASALEQRLPGHRLAIERLRADLDLAIHTAFDLDWPLPGEHRKLLALKHDAVVAAEFRDVVPNAPRELHDMLTRGVRPLQRRIMPHPTAIAAADQWLATAQRLSALAGLHIPL